MDNHEVFTFEPTNCDRGVVIFANNNEQIDYIKIAAANAAMIKHHMGVPVALATNDHDATVTGPFSSIIFTDTPDIPLSDQKRAFVGYGRYEKLAWKNTTRSLVRQFTPFKETIMIDADYLIMDDSLNACFGSSEDILMSSEAMDVLGNRTALKERRLFDTNIPMSWATVVYFKKHSEQAKLFFNLVEHIMKNWKYFTTMFNISSGIFRNDYAFSIAAHLMNDMQDGGIKPTSNETLLTSYAADKIMKIRKGEIDLVAKENDWHYPVKVTQNLHYMNKFDLNDRADEILELYSS